MQTENEAFERAIRAGKAVLDRKPATLNIAEQAMLETFPADERLAVIVFVRWSEGQKWRGGISNKIAAKAAFISAFRIAQEIYAPKNDALDEQAKRGLEL